MGSDVEVTEADREKAMRVLWHGPVGGTEERVAQAIAAERAKARAPFLALAEVLAAEAVTNRTETAWASATHRAADRIRRAAEEGS